MVIQQRFGATIAITKICIRTNTDAFVKNPSGLSFRVKREIFILQPIEKIRFLPLVEMTH